MDAQINITPMSKQEARECVSAIKENMESLRLMLLELHRRRGWEALEYDSWEDCATKEFGRSRSYVFKLLAAAQVEESLGSLVKSPIGDLVDIPVSQLLKLAKLPPDQQGEGLVRANQIAQAQGKKRNAVHVAQAVKLVKQKLELPPAEDSNVPAPGDETDAPADLSATGSQVLPDVERSHTFPTDVNDRLFASVAPRNTNVNVTIEPFSNVSHLQDDQLKQLIKDAKQVIKIAKLELHGRALKRGGISS